MAGNTSTNNSKMVARLSIGVTDIRDNLEKAKLDLNSFSSIVNTTVKEINNKKITIGKDTFDATHLKTTVKELADGSKEIEKVWQQYDKLKKTFKDLQTLKTTDSGAEGQLAYLNQVKNVWKQLSVEQKNNIYNMKLYSKLLGEVANHPDYAKSVKTKAMSTKSSFDVQMDNKIDSTSKGIYQTLTNLAEKRFKLEQEITNAGKTQKPILESLLNINKGETLAAQMTLDIHKNVIKSQDRELDLQRQQLELDSRAARLTDTKIADQKKLTVEMQKQLTTQQQTLRGVYSDQKKAQASTQASALSTSLNDQPKTRVNASTISGKLENSMIYGASAVMQSQLYSSLNLGISTIKEYEQGIVDLRRTIQGVTENELTDFGETAVKYAKNYGMELSQVQSAMTELARAGVDDTKNLKDLTQTVSIGLNTTEIENSTEMVGYLISTIKQLGMSMDDSMTIIDSWNYLSDQYAVHSDDFANAIQRAGAASKTLGLDLYDVNAMVTILGEATQASGESIGTAVKSLEVRLLRPETVKTLESYGIAVKKNEKEFLTFQEIMNNTNNVIKDMDDNSTELSQIMDAMGGAWRKNWIQVLANDWDRFDTLVQEQQDSIGYSAIENTKAMDTWAKKMEQLKQAWVELFVNTSNNSGLTDVLKGVTDGLSGLLSLLTNSGLSSLLIKFAGAMALIKTMKFAGNKVTNLFDVAPLDTMLGKLSPTKNKQNIVDQFAASIKQNMALEDQIVLLSKLDEKWGTLSANQVKYNKAEAESKQRVNQLNLDYEKYKQTPEYISMNTEGQTATQNIQNSKIKNETESLKQQSILYGQNKESIASNKIAKQSLILTNLKLIGTEIALNVAMAGIMMIIGAGIAWLYNLSKANERAIETANELASSYKSASEAISSNIKSLESVQVEFKSLSNGVDDYGNNISLSADKYKRYQEIVQQVVDISPTLITGYNDEGKAIVNKNGLIEQSIALLKEENRQKLENMVTNDSLTASFKGATSEYENVKNKQDKDKQKTIDSLGYISGNKKASMLGEVTGKGYSIIDEYTKGSNGYVEENFDLLLQNLDKIIALSNDKTSKYYKTFNEAEIQALADYKSQYERHVTELEKASKAFNPSLQLVAQSTASYGILSDLQQNFITEYINSFKITDKTSTNEMLKMKEDVTKFIYDISSNGTALNLIDQIMGLNSNATSAAEWKEQIISQVDDLTKELNMSADDLKVKLGVDINMDSLVAVEKSLTNLVGRDITKKLESNYNLESLKALDMLFKSIGADSSNIESILQSLGLDIDTLDKSTIDFANNIVKGFTDPKQAIIELQIELNKFSESTMTLLEILTDLPERIKMLSSAQDEIKTSGSLSIATIQSLIAKYPALESAMVSYLGGVKTASELQKELSKTEQDEKDNYIKLMQEKVVASDEFYDKNLKGNDELVDKFAKDYGIDLANFTDINQLKEAVSRGSLKYLKKITTDNITDLAKTYGVNLENFTTTEEKKLAVATAMSKAVVKMNGLYEGQSRGYIESKLKLLKEQEQQAKDTSVPLLQDIAKKLNPDSNKAASNPMFSSQLSQNINELENWLKESSGSNVEDIMAQINKATEEALGKIKTPEKWEPKSEEGNKSDPSPIAHDDMSATYIKAYNAEVEKDKVANKSLETQIKIARQQQDYNKELELTDRLIKNQEKTVEHLDSANKSIANKASGIRKANSKYDTTKWFDVNGEATAAYADKLASFDGKTDNTSKREKSKIEGLFKSLYDLKKAWADNKIEADSFGDSIDGLKLNKISIAFEAADKRLQMFEDSLSLLGNIDTPEEKAKEIEIISARLTQSSADLLDLQKNISNLNSKKLLTPSQQADLNQYKDREMTVKINVITNKDQLESLATSYAQAIVESEKKIKELNVEGKNKTEIEALDKSIYDVSKEEYDKIDESRKKSLEALVKNYEKILTIDKESIPAKEQLIKFQDELETLNQQSYENLKTFEERYTAVHESKITGYQAEIDAINARNDLEQENLDRAEKKLEIDKLSLELQNTLLNKNVQVLKKQADGSYQFEYIADQSKIDDLNEQLAQKRTDLAKWESDVIKKNQQESLQSLIKYEQSLLDEKKKKYDAGKALLDDELQKEKNSIDLYYLDMGTLVQEKLQGINEIQGIELQNFVDDLRTKADTAEAEWERLYAASKEVPAPTLPPTDSSDTPIKTGVQDTDLVSVNQGIKGKTFQETVASVEARQKIKFDAAKTEAQKEILRKETAAATGRPAPFDQGGEAWGKGYMRKDVIEPERTLSPMQTKDFNSLVSMLPTLVTHMPDITNMLKNMTSAMISKSPSSNGTGKIDISIDNISFPNIISPDGIKEAISSLPRLALQYSRKK